jgi:excisionase family DNA binding protein
MKVCHINNQSATAGQAAAPVANAALISIQDVATLLNCSPRHVYRLVDTRRIPQPVKLGALLRWVKSEFEQWIVTGCPDCRKGNRR